MKQIYFLTIILLISLASKAQTVTIPDTNFKNKLIQLGVDSNNDGIIQTSEAATIQTLNLSNSSIFSLEGIQSFTSLKNLYCVGNTISVLDVSGMTSLINLRCSNNQMTALSIQNLPNLQSLHCDTNLLTEVDASSTGANEFNFSNNPNLAHINIQNNVVSYCITFPVAGSDYTCVMFLNCPQLRIVCLDASEADTSFFSHTPQENVTFATTNCALGIETPKAYSFKLYPNPVQNTLYLETDKLISLKQIYLYNTLGQALDFKSAQLSANLNSIDISSLPKGNYIISIVSDEGKISKKFTKF